VPARQDLETLTSSRAICGRPSTRRSCKRRRTSHSAYDSRVHDMTTSRRERGRCARIKKFGECGQSVNPHEAIRTLTFETVRASVDRCCVMHFSASLTMRTGGHRHKRTASLDETVSAFGTASSVTSIRLRTQKVTRTHNRRPTRVESDGSLPRAPNNGAQQTDLGYRATACKYRVIY
jgi:hypothetical protein